MASPPCEGWETSVNIDVGSDTLAHTLALSLLASLLFSCEAAAAMDLAGDAPGCAMWISTDSSPAEV
jgi:hypothetical protein